MKVASPSASGAAGHLLFFHEPIQRAAQIVGGVGGVRIEPPGEPLRAADPGELHLAGVRLRGGGEGLQVGNGVAHSVRSAGR